MKFENTIIAVDFDGTCVTHEFPNVGRDIGAAPVLKRLTDAGAKLILWTMRSNRGVEYGWENYLTDAINWFHRNKIPLWAAQRNPEQDEWTSSPKCYAHIFIDDAALGCPLVNELPGERPFVDWAKVERILFEETS